MMFKKIGLLVFIILLIDVASAINLQIEKEPINDVIVSELNNPSTFKFTIKNLGESDTFEIYSLVDVSISPKEPFSIAGGETKDLNVKLTAGESIKKNFEKSPGYFTFIYKIKGENTGTQEDRITIKITDLKNVLGLSADNLNPESDKATIHVQNREEFEFQNIEAEFSSVFFKFSENFSLGGLEEKSFTEELDPEILKTLIAGSYLLDADIKTENASARLESTIKFLEKSGISVQENKEGSLIRRHEIEKINEGNTIALAEISIEKNLISRLFTSFNIQPTKSETSGLSVRYIWQQELRPAESLNVVAKTNWYILIIIIIVVIVLIVLARIYLVSDIIVKKKINKVKTKNGEFALKVSINLKARKFVEKINVVDKLPPIVKLYERYGTIAPDRIDEKNRRVEWNIESLNVNEETILSYIVYSKIGIVGRFELPSTRLIYERNGKIKETSSNKVFFVSEPKKIERAKAY